MRRTGPDSLQSWVVAGACCFINLMMYGMARLAGVLFVASIPRFGVSRDQASFPFTFANFVRNASGPLVGFLGHRFGVRRVTALGSLLAAAGIALCFLAESIHAVTALWGGVFGLGFGLGNILLPVSVNAHFSARRATASGVSFAGACLGSFLLPALVERLLHAFGLSGTFLLLAGLVLHCVPAALLLWPPRGDTGERRRIARSVTLYTVEATNAENGLQEGALVSQRKKERCVQQQRPPGLLLDPLFHLVSVTNAAYCFTFVCVFTVVVDFSRDLRIGAANEKFVLMAVSVGDLLGRLGLGWVTDGGHLSAAGFAALLFACQGATLAALPLADGLFSLLMVGGLYGLAEAGLIFLFPVILGEVLEPAQQTIAIPASNFLSGPACLAIPPLIGYFRDQLGAYDYLFYLIALLSFGCCLAWMVVPCTGRYGRRKR